MNIVELINLKILSYCQCKICNLFYENRLVFKIFNTKFFIRIIDNSTTYWIGCPRDIVSEPTCLEDIIPLLSQEEQIILFFNINLLTKGVL